MRLYATRRCSLCGAFGFDRRTHPDHQAKPGPAASTIVEVTPPRRITYDKRRGSQRGRRSAPRSQTLAVKRITREELRVGAIMYPHVEGIERPQTRAECREELRPCPWVACKHHLYLDINPETGSIKLNFPDLEPWELKETCSLDVAERGGITLEEVGELTNLTRERIRQVEVRGLLKLKWAGVLKEAG